MDFNNLGSFLEKFRNLSISNDAIKKEIIDTIFKKTKTIISPNHITIKNNTLFLDITPSAKASIFIHKESILKELKEKLNKKAPLDIR